MRLTADTNVLVRAIVADDAKQARSAQSALKNADLIAIPLPMLCEFVWVLSRGYGVPHGEIADAVRKLVASAKVEANYAAIDAGLALLEAGGDFADGAIAHEGASLGGDTFASFDKEAVALLKRQGRETVLLA
jgi:predicted nucleic-acid-binding protein